jgi:hypothetical protein
VEKLASAASVEGFEALARTALGEAVIHDGDARFQRGECLRNRSIWTAVMCDQVGVHPPNQVLWTEEIEQRLPGQLAVANNDPRRARILVPLRQAYLDAGPSQTICCFPFGSYLRSLASMTFCNTLVQ